MANNPFDRTTIGLRERPVSADLNRNWSEADRSLRASLHQLFNARASASSAAGVASTGFIGDGFRVVPTSPIGMSVQLTAGLGFFYAPTDIPADIGATDLEGVDDRSSYKPLLLTAPQQFAVPAAPGAGNSRIDIIEARYDRRLEDPQTRQQLDATSKAFADHVFFKTLAFALDDRTGTVSSPSPSTAGLSYKVGAVAATGSQLEPAVTTGYVQVARINVGPAATSIDASVLVDRRPLLYPGGVQPFSATWRLQFNAGSPIITVESLLAPPSIQLGLSGDPTFRGAGSVYVVGGQITGGALTIDGAFPSSAASSTSLASLIRDTELGPVFPTTYSSGIAALAAAATPPVIAGVGAVGLRAVFFSRFDTGSAINNTNVALEDVYVSVTGSVMYR